MQYKIVLYVVMLFISMWTMMSLNIEHLFKKNHINQIKVFYAIISIIVAYLLTNFIWEFIQITK